MKELLENRLREIISLFNQLHYQVSYIKPGFNASGDPKFANWFELGIGNGKAKNIGVDENNYIIYEKDMELTNEYEQSVGKVSYNLKEKVNKLYNPTAASIRQLKRWVSTKLGTKETIQFGEPLWLQLKRFQISFIDGTGGSYIAICDTVEGKNTILITKGWSYD